MTVLGSNLFNGNTRSCGCLFRESSVENGKKNALSPEAAWLSAKARVLYGYKLGAKQRGLVWELSDEMFDRLIQAPCFYCTALPSNLEIRKNVKFKYNGIDRRDNSRGYEETNVVSCCWPCNVFKNRFTEEEFLRHAAEITLRHPDMLDLVRSQL